MSMLLVDGKEIRDPSTFSWGLMDISSSSSGRTEDMVMHKDRKGQKRKIQLSWNGIRKEEAAAILQAFNPEYVNVRYPDAMSGVDEERTFYVGDRSAPMKIWTINNKLYTQVSFDIIER